jgi:branched-chain amino acid transport system substrate-binding protein
MKLSRRRFVGTTFGGGLALAGGSFPALADSSSVKVGWLAALTGPVSSGGVGENYGVEFEIKRLNASGGVAGHKIDLVTRDSQSDPTKSVNAVQELITREQVDVLYGPTASGESLATTPIVARNKIPNLSPNGLDELIDPKKYPTIFRIISANYQWEEASRTFCLDKLKRKKIAVVGDSTGYGTVAVAANVAGFQKSGAEVVYQGLIDPTQPDVNPDMVRMRDAGAEIVVVWSLSPGLVARLMNARAAMKWDVIFAGHPTMGSGQVAPLLDKPSNWENVFILNYRTCSMDNDGKLPPRTQEFVEAAKDEINFNNTVLWWVAAGADAIRLITAAVKATGGADKAEVVKFWNSLTAYPGLMGDYTFNTERHNGLDTSELVMCRANTYDKGSFKVAEL